MGEENNPLWGTATIFINGEKLGVLENESKIITNMKTEREITDWLKANMVSMKDMLKICRVLQNMDITIPSITTFDITTKSDYSHFMKWLNSRPQTKFSKGDKVTQNTDAQNKDRVFSIQEVKQEYYGNEWHTKYILDDGRIIKESKLSAYEGKECYIKVGDWVRSYGDNKVFQVAEIGFDCGMFFVENSKGEHSYGFEKYTPKEGEFVSVSNVQNRWIRQWNGGYEYSVGSKVAFMSYKQPTTITELRPATEEEKQTLIKAVEDKFNKTYCEKTKEWVDVKEKSDVKADKVEQGTMPFFTNIGLGRIDLTELQRIAELAGWKTSNVERFRQITKDMADLYERKNKDYGNSFSKGIERRGFGSAVDRLYDKVDRLNQLLVENKTAEVKDESVIDTLKDLANYSIMTILEVEKKKVDK